MQPILRTRMIMASPILVVILGHLAAQFFSFWLGQWAWVCVFIIYWGSMLGLIALFGGRERLAAWFGKPRGSRWWLVIAVLMGLISFPLLLIPNIQVMKSIPLVVAWFAFAVVNSICEEVYWRGFLLDETKELPRAIGVIYSSLLFISVHPLVLGVFSHIQAFNPAHPLALIPFILILVALSLVYCLIYIKTGSLRWTVLSHFLSDLGNLSIFLFMNMVSI